MFTVLEELKKQKKRIGFTSGVFDLLHSGHIMMLQECRAHCDFLIVGILTDPTRDRPEKNKPIQTIWERFVQLQAVRGINIVAPFDTEYDLDCMLHMIMPHIRFVGEEYVGVDHTGKGIPGIEIFYNKRKHPFSSTELRKRKEL